MRTEEEEGTFVGADEGTSLPNPVGGRMVVKIRYKDTAGALRCPGPLFCASESLKTTTQG